jgi:16S rRNA (cytosine1402-N4)-methyltransferase
MSGKVTTIQDNMNDYHVTVLLREAVDALNVVADGLYVDVTFGAGGHSKQIINQLNAKGHLYAFDQDEDAFNNRLDENRFTLIEANFRYLKRFLRLEGITQVDGILADLGVSSHQLDIPERGFSYRFDAPLDMRMNTNADMAANDVLRSYNEEQLVRIFSDYGEVRNSKTLAKAIVAHRKLGDIRTTFELNNLLDQHLMGPRMKYFSQVYQAIRMEVNDEVGALCDLLSDGLQLLKPGGRFSVITFHSIEDRVVKNFFKTGDFDGKLNQDEFGRISRPFSIINKKVIEASAEEQRQNARSRSAKLRVAQKN